MTEPTLRARLQALEALCREVWVSHRDKNDAQYNECDIAECAWCEETRVHLAALLSEEPQ